MKKIARVLLVTAVAAMPAAAMAAKKKVVKEKTAAELNEPAVRLVKNGLPLILPFWAMPIYFHAQEEEAKKHHGKKH